MEKAGLFWGTPEYPESGYFRGTSEYPEWAITPGAAARAANAMAAGRFWTRAAVASANDTSCISFPFPLS